MSDDKFVTKDLVEKRILHDEECTLRSYDLIKLKNGERHFAKILD